MALTNRWAVLALLCFARVSMGLHFQSVAAVAPLLMTDLKLSYAQLGALIGFYTVPGVFLSLPSGLLGARFGGRAVVLIGLGLLTVGGAYFAVSASVAAASLGRAVVGAGGVILSVQFTRMTTDWFVGKEISTALGLMLSTWPLGLALALALLGKLASVTSWQTAIYVASAYSALALILIMLLYQDPTADASAGGADVRVWRISGRELGLASLAGLSWMFINAGFIVYMSFAPTLLMERGQSLAGAGVSVGWSSLVAIPAVPLAGYLADRSRRPNAFMVAGALAAAVTACLLSLWPPAWLWTVLFVLTLSGPIAAIVALPSEVLQAESRSTGFGAWNTVYHVGMAVLPPVAGYLLDVTHSAASPLFFAGALCFMVVPSLRAFRLLQRRWG
jgi:MFS family permease